MISDPFSLESPKPSLSPAFDPRIDYFLRYRGIRVTSAEDPEQVLRDGHEAVTILITALVVGVQPRSL